MEFPQYLWQIRCRDFELFLRRGNDCNEPIEKFERKDRAYVMRQWPVHNGPLIVGIADRSATDDAEAYSSNHRWDWLNE